MLICTCIHINLCIYIHVLEYDWGIIWNSQLSSFQCATPALTYFTYTPCCNPKTRLSQMMLLPPDSSLPSLPSLLPWIHARSLMHTTVGLCALNEATADRSAWSCCSERKKCDITGDVWCTRLDGIWRIHISRFLTSGIEPEPRGS